MKKTKLKFSLIRINTNLKDWINIIIIFMNNTNMLFSSKFHIGIKNKIFIKPMDRIILKIRKHEVKILNYT